MLLTYDMQLNKNYVSGQWPKRNLKKIWDFGTSDKYSDMDSDKAMTSETECVLHTRVWTQINFGHAGQPL